MRLIDTVIIMFLLSICALSVDYEIRSFENTNKIYIQGKRKVDSYYFISESFRMTCDGKGFESFSEWQKTCRSLFGLEYIAWSDAQDFMSVDESEKGKLFYGIWSGPMGNGEVYCRRKHG